MLECRGDLGGGGGEGISQKGWGNLVLNPPTHHLARVQETGLASDWTAVMSPAGLAKAKLSPTDWSTPGYLKLSAESHWAAST